MLCLTRPDVVQAIHEDMFANGADIAETNTFNANRVSQEEYGLEGAVFSGCLLPAGCFSFE